MKAVIFDLMGTLVYVDKPSHPFRHLLARAEVPLDNAAQLAMTSSATSFARLARELESPLTPKEALHLDSLAQLECERITVYPEVLEVLSALKAKRVTVIVCSNLIRPYANARRLLEPYVDYWNFSFDTGLLKPNPAAFLGPVRAFGLKPHECLVVGDSVATDGTGAKAAGMPFILLDRFGRHPVSNAISDLSQILDENS